LLSKTGSETDLQPERKTKNYTLIFLGFPFISTTFAQKSQVTHRLLPKIYALSLFISLASVAVASPKGLEHY
jgi:hypothetical protein